MAESGPAKAGDASRDLIARVEVRGQTDNGPYIETGTGFLVGNQGELLTARHLVVPTHPWTTDNVTGELRSVIYVTMRNKDGLLLDRRGAFLEQDDPRYDVAILRIDGNVFNAGLSTCPEFELIGAPDVLVRGFDLQIDGDALEAVRGAVSDPRVEDNGLRMFSAATRPGFSGAPVFLNDKVVGIVTGGDGPPCRWADVIRPA